MTEPRSLLEARDRQLAENREALIPALAQVRDLIALRIENHVVERCACVWCSLDRAARNARRYCPGGDLGG